MNIICPVCGSSNVYVDKKGYSAGKGIAGTLLTGNILGLAGGFIGSNKVVCECLSCGNKFSPDDAREKAFERNIIENYSPAANDYSIPPQTIDLTKDELLECLIKDAQDAELNGDFDMALLNWQTCLDHIYTYKKNPDMRIVDKAIDCAKNHGNVFRLAMVYEDLLKKWPYHQSATEWKNILSELNV